MLSQTMVLNKILSTKDMSLVTLNNLDDKFFFNYKAEFNFIKTHYEQYRVVPDKLTFANVFPNFDFVDVNEPNNYLLEQLYKDYNVSFIATKYNSIKKSVESNNYESLYKAVQDAASGITNGNVLTCTDLLQDTSRYERYLDRTTDHEKYYLTTGFPEYDAITGGIDRENENMVIMARPGIGKTQVLLKMAAAASMHGLRVGIYEGEMTADKVGYRLDTFIGHFSNRAMNQGYLEIQKEYERYIKTLPTSNYGPIKLLTQNDVPSGEVTVEALKSFIEQNNLDILFIDQYDLMEDNGYSRAAEHEKVGHIAKMIKKLQVEKKIPMIAVCQMTRAKNEDGSQDTTQAAGSDKISRYATVMIALEQKQNEELKQTQLTLNIIKARDGGNGNKLTYFADFDRGFFNYIPTEKDGITTEQDISNIADSYAVETTLGESEF